MSAGAHDDIHGDVESKLSRVYEEFERSFLERAEVGAACCVYMDGRCVVDLWGGSARPGQSWHRDTLAPVFSVTKGATALVGQLLADRGELDVNALVSVYWPEFSSGGKSSTTVKMVLSHTAGIPWFDNYWETVSFDSTDGWARTPQIIERLEAQPALWVPGTKVGYHSFTYGWLVGEIVRRITGRPIGDVFRTEVAERIEADFWIGLPPSEDGRVAELVAPDPHQAVEFQEALPSSVAMAFFLGPARRGMWEVGNSPEYWHAQGPAAGGIANARGIAKMYGMLANGGQLGDLRVVSSHSIAVHSAESIRHTDALFGFESRPALGFARPTGRGTPFDFGPRDEAFGFKGFGGSLGFADPVNRIGFAYVANRVRIGDFGNVAPCQALIDALYESIEGVSLRET